MKKTIVFLLLFGFPLLSFAAFMPFSVSQGGTGFSSTSANTLLASGENATSTLVATSSPAFDYFTATSTTATSTINGRVDILRNLVVGGRISASSYNATSTATSTLQGVSAANLRSDGYLDVSGLMTISGAGTSTITNNLLTNNLEVSGRLIAPSATSVSGMTTGSVVFIGSGSVLTQDNANFFWDDTNNRLGLATTSPGALLSVHGSGLFSGTLSTAGLIATSSTITFSGLGTNMLASINASGNLVATSTPTAAYYLATSSIASQLLYASTTAITASGTASTTALTVSNLTTTRIPFLTTASLFTDDSDLIFTSGNLLTATYASSTSLSTSQGAWFATSGGNVGIGDTSPEGLLHVKDGSAGTIAATTWTNMILESSDTTSNDLQFQSPNNAQARIVYGDTDDNDVGWTTYDHNINAYQIGVNAGVRITIDSTGNVGIGTTSPARLLHVAGGASATTTIEIGSQSTSAKTCFQVRNSDGTATRMYVNGTTLVIEAGNC